MSVQRECACEILDCTCQQINKLRLRYLDQFGPRHGYKTFELLYLSVLLQAQQRGIQPMRLELYPQTLYEGIRPLNLAKPVFEWAQLLIDQQSWLVLPLHASEFKPEISHIGFELEPLRQQIQTKLMQS